jgi:hypothetical protein
MSSLLQFLKDEKFVEEKIIQDIHNFVSLNNNLGNIFMNYQN